MPKLTATDQQIYDQFCHFGQLTLTARNKCIGLLPDIHKRAIYRQKGFNSIYEFAAKIAGLSQAQVSRALNLEPRLLDKPALHQAFVSGEVSLNKLVKVVSISTVENQSEIANIIKKLSVRAVETLVRDEKLAQENKLLQLTKTPGPQPAKQLATPSIFESVHTTSLKLSTEVEAELFELQQKGIDLDALLKTFLQERREKIAKEKELLAKEQQQKATSRHIPIKIRRVISQEHGTKCAVPTCKKPSKNLHHTDRFALTYSHNPHFIAPLCPEHHQIAHVIDSKFTYEHSSK